jgi:hypothetical protein
MSVINAQNAEALKPACYEDAHTPRWRPLHRIDTVGGNVQDVIDAINTYPFERLIYAEGDSWLDKFTPLFKSGTNLLDALRLPVFAGVVDVAHIGDISADMVVGHQARQTKAMFKLFDFDAILFSGGGNDLKNLFAELYGHKASVEPKEAALMAKVHKLETPDADEFVDDVIDNIKAFVAMRDASPRARTQNAPIFVNGYDYLQPRPVKGAIFSELLKIAGPWLYPSMKAAGLSDAQMLTATQAVIDKLNQRMASDIATLPNVYVIDQRGLLTLAAPNSTTESGDWLDEIHPTAQGFEKLVRNRWNCAVAKGVGCAISATEITRPLDWAR